MSRHAKLLAFSAIALGLLSSPASAQDMHEHHHDDAEQLGQVHFPVSCDAASQPRFDRAVAMLHSFWYEKAGEAFAEIAAKDATCAMAYWGLAMTYYHPLWEKPGAEALKNGWAAVERARTIGARTERERGYVAAIEAFFRDSAKTDHVTRTLAYEKAMEQVHSRYLEDREAGVFYSLALIASALALPTDKTHAREKKAAGILNEVLAIEPRHPGVVHYLIHAYDSPPLASLALDAARSYSKIAPAVPHALHMPSHIFTRLGLWQESIQSNLASENAAKKYAAEMKMAGAWDEQLHAMDYLAYAYLQGAQDGQAKAVLDELYQIQKTTPENFKVAYAFAAIPARFALERRRWTEAIALPTHPRDFPWERFPWAQAIVYFARGVGAARGGDMTTAQQSVEQLSALGDKLRKAGDGYWANQVEIQRLAVAAWMSHAGKRKDEALKLMRSAAEIEDATEKHPVTPGPIVPAREMLGDLLLEMGEPRQALVEFEAVLSAAPNRFGSLLGSARAARSMKNTSRARSYYARLVDNCQKADGSRAELQEARNFLRGK
jgi:tetratricopeptide (TPR) repeat protein